MKKQFIVTITKEIELEIPDELLTEDHILDFSEVMYPISSEEEYWEHAAQYVARTDHAFVEGIGQIDYREIYEDVEVEEVTNETN